MQIETGDPIGPGFFMFFSEEISTPDSGFIPPSALDGERPERKELLELPELLVLPKKEKEPSFKHVQLKELQDQRLILKKKIIGIEALEREIVLKAIEREEMLLDEEEALIIILAKI